MPDFSKLLSKPVESAERPKPKAPGTYFGTILKTEFGESRQKKTPQLDVHVGNITPGEDVNMEENSSNGVDLTKWQPRTTFYLTDDSIYRLREFIESCGINTAGRSFAETIPELKNKPVKFTCVNSSGEDGKAVYSNIGEIAGAQ